MTRILDGIRVLEIANWLAAPASAALLSDLGADVIKVEPHRGDPWRGYRQTDPENYAFEQDNRGKRSIALDLAKPGVSGDSPQDCRDRRCFRNQPVAEAQAQVRGDVRRSEGAELSHHLRFVHRLRREGTDVRQAGDGLRGVLVSVGDYEPDGVAGRAAILQRGGMGDHSTSLGCWLGCWGRCTTERGRVRGRN